MKKLLAADIGFGSTGMAIFAWTREAGWQLFDSKCVHTTKGHATSVTLDDIRRTEFLATNITNYFIENQCAGMVCELPNGGAQSASAQKCMAAAVSMIASVRLFLHCPADWITPNQSRTAAGWDKDAHPIPKGLTPKEHRKALNERTKALKAFVIAAMEAKYPTIAHYNVADKEHVADACATFEAARSRQLVKEMQS